MTPEDTEGVVALAITMSLLGGLAGLAVYVWYSLALSKLFTKIGVDSWRGWVPVLNEMEILARGGVPGWSVVYYFIPVVNLYGLYLKVTAVHRINVELGRGAGMTVLGVLLPPVWASVLGWGPTRAVAGVYDKRVESMLGSGDAPAPSVASGPLGEGAPPVARPAPFTQVASDPSGYALPVARPVAPPPAPAFAPPSAVHEDAPVVSPLADDAEPDAASEPSTAPAAVIHNPWAPRQPGSDAPAPPPIISAPPVITPVDEPVAPVEHVAAPEPDPVVAPQTAAEPVAFVEPQPVVEPVAAPAVQLDVEPLAFVEPQPVAVQPTAEPDLDATSVAQPSVASVLAPDDDDDELDRTVVVDRRPVVPWKLRTDDGFEVALTASKIVLGRNPASTELDVEAIAIPDTTRTLSKTHARLDLVDGEWTVTDLQSTNGVLLGSDGAEELIAVGEAVALRSRFVLGKVGMTLSFEPAS
jgi:hypothetical protein